MDVLAVSATAFGLGLASSAHCALMCGPIQEAWMRQAHWKGMLLYHVGRWMTYAVIGLLFYRLQRTYLVALASSESTLMLGITLVTGALMYLLVEFMFPPSWSKPLLKASSWVGRWKGPSRFFAFGILNGALPCGMVWMAASTSASVPSIWAVPVIMLFFTTGTLPALYGIKTLHWIMRKAASTLRLPFAFPAKLKTPTIALIIGVILVVRGVHFQKELFQGTQHTPEALCVPLP